MEQSDFTFKPTVLYLSHGGGPLPLLGDEGHREMVDNLKSISRTIEKPSAIVVISAHWEEQKPTITSGASPSLIYDYYGFPEESYDITYPAAGEPELASQVYFNLKEHGFDAQLDEQRGFDHGLFVPLKIMYPAADIPCIQISLLSSLDPMQHIQMGKALGKLSTGELRDRGMLIIGSGFSFHNMRAFFSPSTPESHQKNLSFESWLIETCSNRNIDENERTQRLANWEQAPFARYCHPREEHLLPLHVCYGVTGRACSQVFELNIIGKKASAYLW